MMFVTSTNFNCFDPPLPSVMLLYTMPYVLVLHNHKPPSPTCVTSFMNTPIGYKCYGDMGITEFM